MPLSAHVGREIAIAGVTGALSLVDPAGLSPRELTAYRVTCATLSGAFTYGVLRDDDLTEHPRRGGLRGGRRRRGPHHHGAFGAL